MRDMTRKPHRRPGALHYSARTWSCATCTLPVLAEFFPDDVGGCWRVPERCAVCRNDTAAIRRLGHEWAQHRLAEIKERQLEIDRELEKLD